MAARDVRLGGQLNAIEVAKRISGVLREHRKEVFSKPRLGHLSREQLVEYLYREVTARRPDLIERPGANEHVNG